MPIVEKKPPAPPAAAPERKQDAGITRAELDAILAERDAAWAQRIEAVTRTLMAAIPKPVPPPAPKTRRVTFETDKHGNPTGFVITQEK